MTTKRQWLIAIAAVGMCRVGCAVSLPELPGWWASDAGVPVTLDLHLAPSLLAQTPADGPPPAAEGDKNDKPPFGAANSWRWYLQFGWAVDIQSSQDQFIMTGGGIDYFMTDNISLSLELNAMYFSQEPPAEDAFGVNFTLLFRWHFLVYEEWTMYVDGGAGILGTTEDVPGPTASDPRGGTSLNFTPQFGFGFTYALEDDVRLFGGVRWYHISNANMQENNPGRDSFMIYGGLSFPF